jgi:threonine dehydrogenase-like Zn-dependent dehydrogenase
VIDYNSADPVETIVAMTGGLGAYRVIDAVGVDANRPHSGPAASKADQMEQEFQKQMKMVAPRNKQESENWHQGDAPSIVSHWSVESIAKGGTLSIIGVYPQTALFFPIGLAMEKQLKINSGNCNHRKYLPELVHMTAAGMIDPAQMITKDEPLVSAIDAYKTFDERQAGWTKVKLEPAASGAPA